MHAPSREDHPLRHLHAVLDRLLRRMTRRLPGGPREMQVDAGTAIGLLHEVDLPNREYVASVLSGVIRELGQRRPDLLRQITFLEETLAEIGDRLREPPEEPGGSARP